MATNRPFDGYPDSFGAKRFTLCKVTGPASYSQYTAPSTGGQTIQVSGPGGVKTIDKAWIAISESGLYMVIPAYVESSTLNGVGVARSAMVLKWIVLATLAEAAAMADLDAETVYIPVLGPK